MTLLAPAGSGSSWGARLPLIRALVAEGRVDPGHGLHHLGAKLPAMVPHAFDLARVEVQLGHDLLGVFSEGGGLASGGHSSVLADLVEES